MITSNDLMLVDDDARRTGTHCSWNEDDIIAVASRTIVQFANGDLPARTPNVMITIRFYRHHPRWRKK